MMLLGGCIVGPDYEAPSPELTEAWSTQSDALHGEVDLPLAWWGIFEDPLLENYIHRAVENNLTLEAAEANILGARALRAESRSAFFPTLDTDFGRSRTQSSGTTSNTFSAGTRRTIYDGGLDTSWELDLFGGLRRAARASEARLDGAMADRDAVLLGVIAEVARTYFDVLGLQKRIAIIGQNIALQERTFGLVEDLFAAGEATEFDVSRARAQWQLTRSRLPDLEAEMKAGVFRLSILLGELPEALLEDFDSAPPLPASPAAVPTGIRSEVLRRRPDIRVAERELAAATEDIGVQVAELFPKFFLTGSIGRASSAFSDLSDSLSDTFSFAQLLEWSLYRGGAIRARIDLEKAEAAGAAARYEQAVLDALGDVESALTRYVEKLATRDRLKLAFDSQQQSTELAQLLFNGGETDFLAVLDAERELIDIEDSLVVSETDALLNLVTLYAALGGGWELFPPADES